MKKILIYLAVCILIFIARANNLSLVENIAAVIFYSIPVIFILSVWEYSDRQKIKISELKHESNFDRGQKLAELPKNLICKAHRKGFAIGSSFALLAFQIVNLFILLLLAVDGKPHVYFHYWLISIILFVLWIIIYIYKRSCINFLDGKIVLKNTNFFLLTKTTQHNYSEIKKFIKFAVQNRRGRIKDFGIGFYTNNNNFIILPLGIAETELQVEQIMLNISLFKDKNQLNFNVENDDWHNKVPTRSTNLGNKIIQITVLILAYFLVPLALALVTG